MIRFGEALRLCFNQRQPDRKSRTATFATTLRADRAAVNFHEMSGDSQAQSKPAVLPSRRAISLSKSLKYVRQKFLADTTARVRNSHFSRAANTRDFHADTPTTLSKLHRVRQQVPNHLLQPVGIARNHRGLRVEILLDLDSLRVSSLSL